MEIFNIGDKVRVKNTHWANLMEFAGLKGIVEKEVKDRWWVQIKFKKISNLINVAHLEKVK